MRTWLLLILCLTGCAVLHPQQWWRPAETGAFMFSLPPDVQQSSAPQANSPITQYTNLDMTITFDDGASAGESLDSLKRYSHFASGLEHIGGTWVQIVYFDLPPGGGHRFDYGMAASYRGLGLSIYAHCRTRQDCLTALKIFKTVRLKASRATRP
jgi:hypothetical protein